MKRSTGKVTMIITKMSQRLTYSCEMTKEVDEMSEGVKSLTGADMSKAAEVESPNDFASR